MNVQDHEALKRLGYAVQNGAANFRGRNIWNIVQKKMRKNQSYHFDPSDFNGLLKQFNS